jgi:hypothetical protein
MSAFTDRVLGPLRALIRNATARVDYFALYSAIVNSDNGDETCDITPEDTRLPSMQAIPKAYGVPGLKTTVAAGSRVLLTHANGDPSKPIIVLYDSTSAAKVSIQATAVNLTGDAPSDAAALGALVDTRLADIWTVLTAATDTGIQTAKTTLQAVPGKNLFPGPTVGSSKVKAT